MHMYGMRTIPLEARYLYQRGMELSEQKKHDAAARCLRQAIVIAPRFTEAYRELGSCLSHLGKPEDAAYCRFRLRMVTA